MRIRTLALLLLLTAAAASAGTRISKTYTRRPLPEVLVDIDKTAPEVSIRFIYNKLEDYLVSCSLHSATPLEAVQQAVGFYPIRVTRKDSIVIVEPVYETDRKIIGRVVNDKSHPLEFANISLYTADSTFVTGGVTNSNGDFVVPCPHRQVIARITFIGYKPFDRAFSFHNGENALQAGTIVLREDPQTLREVIVEQDLATTSAGKSTYIPTKRQRNAATDATALLQHMMIPQLRVNPASGYVTTLSGEAVSIFIDHIPASAEDLSGMNTQDVRRVEILDFPTDVRFQGKKHVVHFIMQKYTLGGYTKLATTDMILADFTSTNSVYSKLAHKRWTFDANITGRFSSQSHIGMEKTETFYLPSQAITRTETAHGGKQRSERKSASLRATYNSDKMQLANRFELLDEKTPRQELYGSVVYSPAVCQPTCSESSREARQLTPTYKGDWNFFLPNGWSLSASPSLQFSRNKQGRLYKEASPIEYNVKENAYKAEWVTLAGKSFAKKHSLQTGTYGFNYNSSMDYSGSTTAHQDMDYLALGIPVIYKFQAQKLKLEAQAVATYEHNEVNGETLSKWAPMASLEATYAFTPKNSLEAELGVGLYGANGAERNPNIMQENELLYYCGNPLVENYNSYFGRLQYTWMPSNKFTASALLEHYYHRDYFANVWNICNGGTAILRGIENVGDAHFTNISASLTLRLSDGSLQLNASPYLSLQDVSGLNKMKDSAFFLDLKASYYIGQFYFRGCYSLPEKVYYRENTSWLRRRSVYYITAGWGSKHWKAKADIVNPFRTDWRANSSTIATPLYSQRSESFNSSSHQRINLTLTYIFNYGKKVKQGNELGTASGGQSSIL